MKKTLYTVLCLMVGVFTLSGCVEEYEADISSEDSNLLVVEGTICSSKLNKFYLSRAQALNSYTPRMVAGAIVTVHGTDGSEYRAQANGDHYACWIDSLSPEVEYYLHIEADGEIYESDPQRPLRTEKIADVRGGQLTPETIDVFITPDDPLERDQANYYSWTYDETWEVRPVCKTAMYFDPERREPVFEDIYHFPIRGWLDATSSTVMVGASTNYDGQHIQGLKLYGISPNDSRIFYRYSGLVHQRAISKAEYEYELARRQAGSEMGGLFTPQPSALPTNIHCLSSRKHVIGFVGCSLNTSEYRFFLNGEEYSTYRPSGSGSYIWVENPSLDDCCQMVYRGLYLCDWQDSEKSVDGKLHAAWAFLHQLDIRYKYDNVYLVEPDFWSLKENVSY